MSFNGLHRYSFQALAVAYAMDVSPAQGAILWEAYAKTRSAHEETVRRRYGLAIGSIEALVSKARTALPKGGILRGDGYVWLTPEARDAVREALAKLPLKDLVLVSSRLAESA